MMYIMYLILIDGVNGFLSHKKCDGASLVEDFFNVMLTEFRNMPSCVCVQMCTDAPTYCYPNGCFHSATKKDPARIDNAQGIFLVERNKDFFDIEERNITTAFQPHNEFRRRPNKFSDLMFRQKRPKLIIRYNLREQVKNTKRDSQARWPRSRIPKIKNIVRNNLTKRDNADNFSLEAIIDAIDSSDDIKVTLNDSRNVEQRLQNDKSREGISLLNNRPQSSRNISFVIDKISNEIDNQNNMNSDKVEKFLIANMSVRNLEDTKENLNNVPKANGYKVGNSMKSNRNARKRKYV